MAEKHFFFEVDGDTRKVSVPFLDSVSDLVPLLASKYSDMHLPEQTEFWTKDQKFGVKFQITSAEDIYNGAVLEVVTHREQAADSNHQEVSWSESGGVQSHNPYLQAPGAYLASESGYADGDHGPGGICSSGGFNDAAGEFNANGPMQLGFNTNVYGGLASSYHHHGQSGTETQNCSLHNKKRTLQNLTQKEDGT